MGIFNNIKNLFKKENEKEISEDNTDIAENVEETDPQKQMDIERT